MIRSVSLIGAESTDVRCGAAVRARAGRRPRRTGRRRRARRGARRHSCSAASASSAGSGRSVCSSSTVSVAHAVDDGQLDHVARRHPAARRSGPTPATAARVALAPGRRGTIRSGATISSTASASGASEPSGTSSSTTSVPSSSATKRHRVAGEVRGVSRRRPHPRSVPRARHAHDARDRRHRRPSPPASIAPSKIAPSTPTTAG